MRLLVIEDDPNILSYIGNGLQQSGYVVDKSTDGKDGLFLASTENYDAIIVDRMLPSLDGLSIIKALRGMGKLTPILILSALAQVDDKVKGLRAGGNDYLIKPFAFAELLARVEVLCRKGASQTQETVLKAGDLSLDLLARKVTRGDKIIDLQAREFRLLEYMLHHKGQVVTRTMLLENVWDYNFDPQTNVIDVHVSRLRSKINRDFSKDPIKTVRGAGYMIDEE